MHKTLLFLQLNAYFEIFIKKTFLFHIKAVDK